MPGASIAVVDGKTHLSISQSWLNTYIDCPEAARQILLQTYPESTTPEAYLGTTLHAAIDLFISKGIDPTEYIESKLKGYKLPGLNAKGEPHKWDNSRSDTAHWTVLDLALDCWDHWLDHLWIAGAGIGGRGPGNPEFSFERVVYEDDEVRVTLIGQIDYHLKNRLEMWDWKFSARRWEPWEVQRYDIQSACYTVGLHGLEIPGEVSFNFGVTNPDNLSKSRVVSITRDQRHVDTLIEDTIAPLARLIKRQPLTEKWPALSTSWKCSPKWCEHFDACRGRHGLTW